MVCLTTYLAIVGEALRLAGVPPAGWFGSDYVDPRGAAVSFSAELVFIGLAYFAVGRTLSQRLGDDLTRLEAFWLSNPLSTAIGVLASRSLMINFTRFEFTSGALFLLFLGWPVFWHLTILGARNNGWKRAIAIGFAYSVSLLVAAIVQAYRVYTFE